MIKAIKSGKGSCWFSREDDYDSHFSQNEFFVLVLLLICNFHASATFVAVIILFPFPRKEEGWREMRYAIHSLMDIRVPSSKERKDSWTPFSGLHENEKTCGESRVESSRIVIRVWAKGQEKTDREDRKGEDVQRRKRESKRVLYVVFFPFMTRKVLLFNDDQDQPQGDSNSQTRNWS